MSSRFVIDEQATARNIIFHWENLGVNDSFHVAIWEKMGLLPSVNDRDDREQHKYLIGLLKKSYKDANYPKSRRRWLQLHSLPRGNRLRNLLATAEPYGYRTKGDGGEDNSIAVELDNPSGPVVPNGAPKRRQIPSNEVDRLVRETLFDRPGKRNAMSSFEQADKEPVDKATQADFP